jgi:hypothetical protein
MKIWTELVKLYEPKDLSQTQLVTFQPSLRVGSRTNAYVDSIWHLNLVYLQDWYKY